MRCDSWLLHSFHWFAKNLQKLQNSHNRVGPNPSDHSFLAAERKLKWTSAKGSNTNSHTYWLKEGWWWWSFHSPTEKALWTSPGWGRTVKSIVTAQRLSSLGSDPDERWLQRSKAGGFRPANGQGRVTVSQSGWRDWNSSASTGSRGPLSPDYSGFARVT